MALPAFAAPSTTDATLVYTVPDGQKAAVSINVAATVSNTAKIAITPPGTVPGAAHWLETGQALNAGQVLERTGLVLTAGCRVYVQSDKANSIAAQVLGIEE